MISLELKQDYNDDSRFVLNSLTANSSIRIFTHLKLCLADAIHNLSEWKLFWFDKMKVSSIQILLVDVTIYL